MKITRTKSVKASASTKRKYVKCSDYNPDGFMVSGYKNAGYIGSIEDRYFDPDEWLELSEYAEYLLNRGLHTSILYFTTGDAVDIDPNEYRDIFDCEIELAVADWKRKVWKHMGIKSTTSTKRKYTVKASHNSKPSKVTAGYQPPYAVWVFDGDDNMWKTYKASNTPNVDDGFLDRINHIEYPNYTVENNYTDVVVLPNDGTAPEDGRPVKEYASASTKMNIPTNSKCTANASKSVTASEDGPLQVCRSCLLGIESHEGKQVVYDTIEYDDWDEDAEPLICDWCEDEADILYQITPDDVEGSTDRSSGCVKASKSVTASVGDAVDVTEIREILENAGFGYMDVEKTKTHLGDEYKIYIGDESGSDVMDAIRDAGFSVEFDTTSDGWMYLFITDERKDPTFLYRVSYDYTSDIVEMDDETGDYQQVVDMLIDTLEARGEMGYLMTIDEAEAEYDEDEYEIGGNHGFALIHGGNFNIEPLGWSNEVDVAASVDIDTMRDRFLNPEEFVFFFDGKEMYRGDGAGFSHVIADLCKDESTNQKFQEWCNQFGDPFDFDGTPKDTAFVFAWLVGQERMEQDDFYLDGSGILNFEICNTSDMVESSESIEASIGRPNPTDDKEYYTALAEGVVQKCNEYWEDTNVTYEISDSAITFDDNGAVFIQPLENITPDWGDLDDDIEELSDSVIGVLLPF